VSDYLAIFSINISRMIDPEVIIFAGGMANAGDFLLSRIKHHFMRRTWTVLPSSVKLSIAASCDNAGMLGAAAAASKLQGAK
jgi:glucokinase